MAGRELEDSKRESILKMYAANCSIAMICAELNTSPQTIYRVIYNSGTPLRGKGNRDSKETVMFEAPSEYSIIAERRALRLQREEANRLKQALLEHEIVALADAGMPATEIAASLGLRYHSTLRILGKNGFKPSRGRPLVPAHDWQKARRWIRDRFAEGKTALTIEDILNHVDIPQSLAFLALRSEMLRIEYHPESRERAIATLPEPQMAAIVDEIHRRLKEEATEAGWSTVVRLKLHDDYGINYDRRDYAAYNKDIVD